MICVTDEFENLDENTALVEETNLFIYTSCVVCAWRKGVVSTLLHVCVPKLQLSISKI